MKEIKNPENKTIRLFTRITPTMQKEINAVCKKIKVSNPVFVREAIDRLITTFNKTL